MSYYGGGYMGFMGRGDPGFFGTIGHVLGGAVTGFFKGGPIGAIAGAIGGTVAATRSNIGSATLSTADDPAGDAARIAAVHRQHAATLARVGAGRGAARMLGAGRIGGRRMRWTNTKALGRAERRIHAAVKHMSRYIKWVHPKREGHAAPKFGKKRAKR